MSTKELLIMRAVLLGFFLVTLSVRSLVAQAPNYQNFEWDVGSAGISIVKEPIGSVVRGGLTYNTEVRYNSTNTTSWGVQAGFTLHSTIDEVYLGLRGVTRIAVFRDHYFRGDNERRSFAGIGIGHLSGTPDRSMSITPRYGYEFGPVRLALQYEHTIKSSSTNTLSLTFAVTAWGNYQSQ